ncbi:MAG: hypothetical protein IIT72_06130 [Lachnospiraceae bacterium]|nr:hypothetical protein [Lachnospiraceae bacterium]
MDGIGGFVEIYAGVIVSALLAGTLFQPHYRDERRRVFLILEAAVAMALFTDGINCLVPIGSRIYLISSISFRFVYYVMLAFLGFYLYESLRGEGSPWPFWPMVSIPVAATCAVLYEVAGLIELNLLRVPNSAMQLELISNLGDYLITAIYVLMIMASVPVLSTGKMVTLLLTLFVPLTASVIGQVTEGTWVYLSSLALSIVILYIFDYNTSQWKYARKLAMVADQQTEMVEQSLKIDFILDSLDQIEELAMENPVRTSVEAKALRDYIAHTVKSLKEVKQVTFARELAAIKQMLKLENFKNPQDRQIQAEYNIEDASFKIPSLAIRMLAENAVASLMATDRRDRRIWIDVRERQDFYELCIRDNGLLDPEHDVSIGEAYTLTKDLAVRQLEEYTNASVKVLQSSKNGRILQISVPKTQ